MDPRVGAEKLEAYFKAQKHAIIAYSGGVDSALMAYAAHRALKHNMVAVLADSPSLARREYRFAKNFAQTHGMPLQIIRTRELDNPRYQANHSDRCYHCKKALFEKIEALRQQLQGAAAIDPWPVSYGVNMDDLGDYRPGIQAAREASIQAPYVELQFAKQTIRSICAYYHLDIAEKPAMPCMASRLAYGQQVTREKLNQVEQAEDFLYDLGLRVLRVRHHGDTARIEVPSEDFDTILEHHQHIRQTFHDLGFIYVALDLDGFRSGSLNSVLNSD
ncbi:MAG: ATP-dependent sacrificial sulfur transferase LarE [Deltaproteobacteria bacterium]|nr:ATP-dependent sacrificial sulfur transferase LarE [Deltaproteobacteria bacterium]MBW2482203.1 ATP-dependent sacrificial sulfur transferase LarE [Deltaproteobacteria bacterium]